MHLHDLLADLPTLAIDGPADIEISSLAYDPRAARPGGLFIAISGFHVDGHAYIPQALAAGAAALVVEKHYWDEMSGRAEHLQAPTVVVVSDSRIALAPLAAAFYGHPGRAMRVVGITGTDGKTTTTFLTSAVLEAGGHSTGMMGTVDFKVAGRQWANDAPEHPPRRPRSRRCCARWWRPAATTPCSRSTSHALGALAAAG